MEKIYLHRVIRFYFLEHAVQATIVREGKYRHYIPKHRSLMRLQKLIDRSYHYGYIDLFSHTVDYLFDKKIKVDDEKECNCTPRDDTCPACAETARKIYEIPF